MYHVIDISGTKRYLVVLTKEGTLTLKREKPFVEGKGAEGVVFVYVENKRLIFILFLFFSTLLVNTKVVGFVIPITTRFSYCLKTPTKTTKIKQPSCLLNPLKTCVFYFLLDLVPCPLNVYSLDFIISFSP